MQKVLVTRPSDDAERLALRVTECGFYPILAPLLTIEPHVSLRPCSGGIAALMVTSHNALDGLRERQEAIRDLLSRPCFCVGHRTAEAARRYGFRDVLVSYGDGRVLADMIQNMFPPDAGSILHPCGLDRTEAGSDILKASGYDMRPWPVYEAKAETALPDQVKELLITQKLDAGLFFSPRTAAIFCDLAHKEGVEVFCRRIMMVGLSEAVAASLRLLNLDRVIVADTPTEDAMITALTQGFEDEKKQALQAS